jgi:hypothetical protein
MELLLNRKTAEALQKRYPGMSLDQAVNEALRKALSDPLAIERAEEIRHYKRDWLIFAIGVLLIFTFSSLLAK